MKSKKFLIVAIIVIVLVIAGILLMKKPSPSVTQKIQEDKQIINEVINCQNDPNCVSNNFLKCKPLSFKMDFPQGGSYILQVKGKEGNNCRYLVKLIKTDGSLMIGFDCLLPIEYLSKDTLDSLFGNAQGELKTQQEQYQLYCRPLQQ
ncbi:MAG: hypothetical protein ACP5OX_00265 [Minisyncoccia bacterium]